MKKIVWLSAISLVLFLLIHTTGCNSFASGKFKRIFIKQDTAIYLPQQYSTLLLDSNSLKKFIHKDTTLLPFEEDIVSFYLRRNYQLAWFTENELTNSASNFLSILQDYQDHFGDSTLLKPLHEKMFAPGLTENSFFNHNKEIQESLELALTTTFFKYANKVYSGTSSDPKDLEWYIPRNKKNYQILLDTLVTAPASYQIYEPVNDYYKSLKVALIQYREIEKKGGLPKISLDRKILKKGDSSEGVIAVEKYLKITKDYEGSDTISLFSDSLANAVRYFQQRVGLKETGIVDSITVAEMNESIQTRIKKIMLNMERLRWLPDATPDDYILVNIPEYRLHLFEEKKYLWSMNVVVGNQATATSVFKGNLSVVSFSPYWRVPESIIRNEILPQLKRNPFYLSQKNMEAVSSTGKPINTTGINWKKYNTGVPFVIRQKPGASNALGRVVFYFPNRFDIYMHDTPAKSFFNETNRAFSHGCIRLAEPKKLAEYLFRKDSTMTSEKISELMLAGTEKKISVKPSLPVFICYFTTWVDHDGKLNFRKDIYGLDAKLGKEVFGW